MESIRVKASLDLDLTGRCLRSVVLCGRQASRTATWDVSMC